MPWNSMEIKIYIEKDGYFSPLFKESCRGTQKKAGEIITCDLISVLYSKSHAVEQRFSEGMKMYHIFISVLYSKSHAVELSLIDPLYCD